MAKINPLNSRFKKREEIFTMSGNVKIIIAGVAVIALLSGGIVAMNLTSDDSSDSAEVTTENMESTLLYDKNPENVVSIKIKNSSADYEIVRASEATEDTDASYTIEEYEGLPINYTLLNAVPNSIASMSSEKTVEENASDLSKYGLDNPSAEVTVTFDDDKNTVKEMCFGDYAPSGDYMYMCFKGENTVYTVDDTLPVVFTYDEEYFISLAVIEEPSDEDYPIVEKVSVERSELDYPIVMEYDQKADDASFTGGTAAAHIMTEPVFAYLDVSTSTDYTHGLFGLTANSVASVKPSDSEKTAAGLDKPACIVKMECDDDSDYTLTIGSKVEVNSAYYYCGMVDGIDVLYLFSADSVPWAEMEVTDVTSQLVFGTYFYDIGQLLIETADYTLDFQGEGEDEDSYTCTLNGEECTLDRFKEFYQFAIMTSAEELYLEEPEGEPIVKITLKRQDGQEGETVEYYRGENRKTIIKHNGVTSFACRSTFLDVMLDNIERAAEGDEELVTVW